MSEWVSLGSVALHLNGEFRSVDIGQKAGIIGAKVGAFQSELTGSYTLGLYFGTQENPGFVSSDSYPIEPYERVISFQIPSGIINPLIGIRSNQEGEGIAADISYNFSENCCEESAGNSSSTPIPLELPKAAFLRSIRIEEMKRPTTILKIQNEYWVFCFSAQAQRFDAEWNYLGEIGPVFERPRDSNAGADRVWDASPDFQADRLYLSCSSRNLARCYRLSTFTSSPELLSTIPSDGSQIRFSAGCAVLPNGNLALASRLGIDADSNGAILEYSPDGELIQILVSYQGSGGLIEGLDYQDWFGKVRWMDGKLWAVSYSLRMIVSWELTIDAGSIVGIQETYRRFFIPSGLPSVAGWTPHGIAIYQGELLATQNANNGIIQGLYKGVYSLDLEGDYLLWSEGQQIEFGKPTWGEHPALFDNPHDVFPLGFWNGREAYAVADYGDDAIKIIPRPEFMRNFLPYITVPIAVAQGSEIASPSDIELDAASNTAQCPVYRLAPSVP